MGNIDAGKFRFRDKDSALRIIDKLKALQIELRVMHVCGTHQDTLVRYGLEPLLREAGVEVRQGPGCPVCVTTTREIEECLALARAGKRIAAFGDMMRVPAPSGSLFSLQAEGADVKMVYSAGDAVKLALADGKETVFMGVGFETTTPGAALTVEAGAPDSFSVLSCHRTVPP